MAIQIRIAGPSACCWEVSDLTPHGYMCMQAAYVHASSLYSCKQPMLATASPHLPVTMETILTDPSHDHLYVLCNMYIMHIMHIRWE